MVKTRITSAISGRARARRGAASVWKSPALVFAVATTLLAVACSGGAASPSEPASGPEAAAAAAEPAVTSGSPAGQAAAYVTVSRSPDAVPDFELEMLGNESHKRGELVKLSSFIGQPVVLNFWFPSCPPCRREMPDFENAWKAHKIDGVQFLGVQQLGLDSIQDGQDFIEDFELTYSIGADKDNRTAIDYKIVAFPTTVFLDAEQKQVVRWDGPLNREKLEELIAKLIE